MRFKTDENLPIEAADLLRKAGHDVATVAEQRLVGDNDSLLVDACGGEHRVLITLDVDFVDIRKYPPGEHEGIIVLRLRH